MSEKKPKIIISETATCHGWGSDPYKWASGMSQEEISAMDRGGIVVILPMNRYDAKTYTHAGNPPYRVAKRRSWHIVRRVPGAAERKLIEVAIDRRGSGYLV